MDHFAKSSSAKVNLVVCDNPGAGVLERAERFNVDTLLIDRTDLAEPEELIRVMDDAGIELIVLAGFLKLIPFKVLNAFPDRVVNIHPSLLPKYGGKGMYGRNVHQAVLEAKEKESGITIHYVNEHYDDGQVIFQAQCPVLPDDTPESLADRIHRLEHEHYPKQIDMLINE